MAGFWLQNSVQYEWDGEFDAPHPHVVSGQWAINYGLDTGAELTTIRNDVVCERARVLGDGYEGRARTVTILDADNEPMFVLEQTDGAVEQVFSLVDGERRLSYSHVTWTLPEGYEDPIRENDEFVCEDHREIAGVQYDQHRGE